MEVKEANLTKKSYPKHEAGKDAVLIASDASWLRQRFSEPTPDLEGWRVEGLRFDLSDYFFPWHSLFS